MKNFFATMVAILAISFIAYPALADQSGQPRIVDDALRSEVHIVWSTSQSVVVPYAEIDAWEEKAHASGMIHAVRGKINRGETGYYTTQALGRAASRFGDALVLQQAGGEASSLAYKSWKRSKNSADMREEVAEQFVSALLQGAMNGATAAKPVAPSVSVADFRRVADKVVALEAQCDSLKSQLRGVAHTAAVAANEKADWKKVRKPAIDWLARY